MSGTAPRRVRVYAALRTAHLERMAALLPAHTLYTRTRYDYDESVLGDLPEPELVSRVGAARHLLTTSYDTVELNEPFMVARWPDLAAQLLAVRLRGWLDRRQPLVSAYCLSLKDPVQDLVESRSIPPLLAGAVVRIVLGGLVRGYDRLAFGTDTSADLMAQFVPQRVLRRRAKVFPAVPAACGCLSPDDLVPRPRSVLFVGTLAPRKGVDELMSAWDGLRARDGEATLTVVGRGPLLDAVRTWARERPEVDVVVDPPRSEVHAALRRARVLVLLSQREGPWREQVGLPIVEGLGHGCKVVASDETGLAGWLAGHGHRVVPARSDAGDVATAMLAALDDARRPSEVLADLPATDARIDADRWMSS